MIFLYIICAMAIIYLQTSIQAPIERVFDLSRSIDLHKLSTAKTNEQAIAGVTKGLISLNETVTWQAKHLFKTRRFVTKITKLEFPVFFEDAMQQGDFKSFRHEHYFENMANGTIMKDVLEFYSPFGWLGKMVDICFMKNYLQKFLMERNQVIKEFAEGDGWRKVL